MGGWCRGLQKACHPYPPVVRSFGCHRELDPRSPMRQSPYCIGDGGSLSAMTAKEEVGMTWEARPLFPEDLSQTPQDAAESTRLGVAGLATAEEGTQQATQARCTRVAVLLAEKGQQAGGDGGEDVAH